MNQISFPGTWVDDTGLDDGTIIDTSVFQTILDWVNDTRTGVDALEDQSFLKGYDSVIAEYKDAATITLQADGQFTSSDGTTFYTISTNTDVSFTSNLSSDVGGGEASDTLYFVWGGEDSNGDQEYWITDSAVTMPSELVIGRLLRPVMYNDSSSNLLPFYMSNHWYIYDTDSDGTGSDITEVLDQAVSTSFVEVNCSGFVPPLSREVVITHYTGANVARYYRMEGSAETTGFRDITVIRTIRRLYLDDNGKFETKNGSSQTTRIAVVGYFF